MELGSPSFASRGEIPARHTCEGANVAPPLQWTGIPGQAASLVLIVDEPDAPDPAAPQTTWVHWVLYDIPPAAPGLPEGGRPLPAGAREGLNDWGRHGYGCRTARR
ncbi:MAG: YbhB/YbcL family Raf kinase inhibitor-like protein [Caldimonas sp.]